MAIRLPHRRHDPPGDPVLHLRFVLGEIRLVDAGLELVDRILMGVDRSSQHAMVPADKINAEY